jgi:AdoMet-dependent heme synthase
MRPDALTAPAPRGGRPPSLAGVDFDQRPFLVIWETTQACDLACVHCRACAQPTRHPEELSTGEARALLESIRRFGRPLVVLTGGDPLKRPDMVELVEHGTSLGLRMAMTPSGTPLMTPAVIRRLANAGLARLAVSLDGSTAALHDAFRGVAGSWEWTIRMIREARALGLSTQINTTVTRTTLPDFEGLVELMAEMEITLWSVFFLVPTGRAQAGDIASPESFERVFERMYELSLSAPFDIKSTAAPHYRRVVLQRQVAKRRAEGAGDRPDGVTGGIGFSLADGVGRARGVNDGNGFLFVSHTGEIYPSGFLPLAAGNVRRDDLLEVYRHHPLFTALRDPDRLKGKCGVCEYREVCGGSRARAYALSGDPLEAEPFCTHVPARYARQVEEGAALPVEEYFAGWTTSTHSRAPKLHALGAPSPMHNGR